MLDNHLQIIVLFFHVEPTMCLFVITFLWSKQILGGANEIRHYKINFFLLKNNAPTKLNFKLKIGLLCNFEEWEWMLFFLIFSHYNILILKSCVKSFFKTFFNSNNNNAGFLSEQYFFVLNWQENIRLDSLGLFSSSKNNNENRSFSLFLNQNHDELSCYG